MLLLLRQVMIAEMGRLLEPLKANVESRSRYDTLKQAFLEIL